MKYFRIYYCNSKDKPVICGDTHIVPEWYFLSSINITGFLLLLTLPILTGALIMSLADLHYNTVFFNPRFFFPYSYGFSNNLYLNISNN